MVHFGTILWYFDTLFCCDFFNVDVHTHFHLSRICNCSKFLKRGTFKVWLMVHISHWCPKMMLLPAHSISHQYPMMIMFQSLTFTYLFQDPACTLWRCLYSAILDINATMLHMWSSDCLLYALSLRFNQQKFSLKHQTSALIAWLGYSISWSTVNYLWMQSGFTPNHYI